MVETDTTARPIGRARIEPPDLSEKGGLKDGVPQRSDRRLFMQLLAFGGCRDPRGVASHMSGAADEVVVYEDLNDPRGIAVLTVSEEPETFVRVFERLLAKQAEIDAVPVAAGERCAVDDPNC